MRVFIKKIVFFPILLLLINQEPFGQQTTPRQEKLLNGLKLLVWYEPNADKVELKLRIHKGSAFDLKDKAGMMALLGDILFPKEQTKKLFVEDFGGDLTVKVTYDYIQIEAIGKTEDFLTMTEIIANAVTDPPVTKENFSRVLEARIEKVKKLEEDDAYFADIKVAERLLGTFPYGRPVEGTSQSLRKVELADIVFARDRYFTADNATLIVRGKVNPNFVYMTVRQLFGLWKKAERVVPATFRQPDDPDTTLLVLDSRSENLIEARSALRGLARNDKDYFAAEILARVLTERLRNQPAQIIKASVIHQANFLPGILVSRFSIPKVSVSFTSDSGNYGSANTRIEFSLTELLRRDVTMAEFDKAKSKVLAWLNSMSIYDLWLDIDTYGLVSVKNEFEKANATTLQDVNSLLEQFRKRPVVNIVFMKKGNF